MQYLPLFPLELVAFPGEALNLHIFEPRYRELMHDCETQGLSFGIPVVLDGKLQPYGTEVRLAKVEKRYPDGKLDVRTTGLAPFRLLDFDKQADGKMYAGGRIRRLPVDERAGDPELVAEVRQLLVEMYQHLPVDRQVPKAADFRAFQVGHHAGLNTAQEFELLQLSEENLRLEYLHQHLQRLLPSVREMQRLRQRVQMNGHFKNILPPDFRV